MTSPAGGHPIPKKVFDYDVIEPLGEGARSTIYAVSHPQTKQLYALKHVKRKTDKDERFIEQLMNEYEVARKINHPNLRKMVDMKLSRSLLLKVTEAALVMELFDGQPLEKSLPRSLGHMVQVFIDTAKALEAMHNHGLVHCDLKPNNILLSPTGQVKVIDLGQACPAGTEKKRIQGTPDYIAPEQVKLRPVSPRTDIYNLGATMYWALTKRNIPTLYTTRRKHGHSLFTDEAIPSPHVLNPMVPETLANFVMECVRSDPRKRPADMAEVIRRLEIIQHTITRHRQSGSSVA
jgi:serine/threonine-protein kinase